MTEFKHLKVLHIKSNKIVSTYQLTNDATWIGKERDKLIAIPADTPEEIKEIEMIFTTGHSRYKGTNKEIFILPFFKRKSGQPETLSERKVGGESEAHRLAKNEVYEKLFNNELTINNKTVQELGITDLDISEEYHSKTGHAIADVFLHFGEYPNHHQAYGEGICIEVQFSPQEETKTSKRTLQRLREGWSVVWLWEDDFFCGKLKLKNLKVANREEQLKDLREDEYDNLLKKMNKIGKFIDEKTIDSIGIFSEKTQEISKVKKREFKDWIDDRRDEVIHWDTEIKKERDEEILKLNTCFGTTQRMYKEVEDNLKIAKKTSKEARELSNDAKEKINNFIINKSKEIEDNYLESIKLEIKKIIDGVDLTILKEE